MLKLGFVSAILADFGYEHVIDFAANHGFSCVEIMCWPTHNADARRYAGVTHIDADRVLTDTIYAHNLIHFAKEKQVTISALGYYPNPLDPDADKAVFYREHIKQLIKAAAKLGLHNVNTFIGRDPSKSITENLKTFGKVWPEIIQVAEAHNVKIGIENCPMFFIFY